MNNQAICANCRHLIVPADERPSAALHPETTYPCHYLQAQGVRRNGQDAACPAFTRAYHPPDEHGCKYCIHLQPAGIAYVCDKFYRHADPNATFSCYGFKKMVEKTERNKKEV